MGIDRKLREWQEAGLLDAEAVERIRAHEDKHSRPAVLYAVAGVGAFAIVLGLVAVIASNWENISGGTKIAADFLLGLGLAAALFRSEKGWLREVLLVVYYGFVLASLGLIGQVYQLQSEPWRALALWSAATFPFMLLVEGRFAASTWLCGLAVTHAHLFEKLAEWVDRALGLTSRGENSLLVVLIAVAPFCYLGFAKIPRLGRERPVVAQVFWENAWLVVASIAFGTTMLFYTGIPATEVPRVGALLAAALWAGVALALPRLEPELAPRALAGLRGLLLAGAAMALLALPFEREAWSLLAAVTQTLMLAGMAWVALQVGYESVFRLGTAAVCVRLFIVYIEVFGSMLQSGLGLIVSGLVTIGLCWWWVRRSKSLAASLRPPAGGTRP
jgi:uncharacterized membrane protein